MAGEIHVSIIGNLTADPETRQAGGVNVTGFTVAVTPRKFDKQTNEWVDDEAQFYRCSVWREYGDNVAASLTKGARVIVTGALKQRKYEKDGVERTSLEIDVEEIGPSLRYATAQVVKSGSNRTQTQRHQQAAQQGGPGNLPPRQQQQQQNYGYDPNVPF